MKRGISRSIENQIIEDKKGGLIWAWQNQPPIMYWWFIFSSISLCSVYAVLLTHL
ncbi:MAG: hypothetical protein WC197_06965 [Candidatus Gastranaerophilaceae bacterium]|jgi:hypothetical protein